MKIFLRLSVAALLLAILAGQSLAAPIGQVSGVRPGASVDRDGESIALKLKDSIEAKDTLHTALGDAAWALAIYDRITGGEEKP